MSGLRALVWVLVVMMFVAGDTTSQVCGECEEWNCGASIGFGGNQVNVQVESQYYGNNMACTTRCICPAGTDTITVSGVYDTEPVNDYIGVLGKGGQFISFSGKGEINQIINGSYVDLAFSSNDAISNCPVPVEPPYGGLTISTIECVSKNTTLRLDVGNDTDYEWTAVRSFRGPVRLDLTESMRRYVRGGCWCQGCIFDASSGNCTVPVLLKSTFPGNLTVNDVLMNFTQSTVLGEVDYGMPFRRSEGGCWNIQYSGPTESGQTGLIPIPPTYNGGVCSTSDFEYPVSNPPFVTDDAVDDAVYRLLNQTLDTDSPKDGRINVDYSENMSFESEGKMGVQSMWGPVQMRLIVWS